MLNWKTIPDFPNYECSDTGEFRRNGKILKAPLHPHGYKHIRLYKDGKQYCFKAHRVVYETFVNKIPNGLEINHKNGIKNDNSLQNLECCSHSENMRHAIKNNLLVAKIGKDNVLSVPIVGINQITGEKIHFPSQADARRAGFNQGNIQAVLKGARSQHKQYVWAYA